MSRRMITFALLALTVIGIYWFAAVPRAAAPEGQHSAAMYQPGPNRVVTERFLAVDETRPLQPNKDFKGLPQRKLKGKIWRPFDASKPMPIVVYSHGFMSFYEEGRYLNEFLASHGYLVVAVNYPLTHFFAPGGPLIDDLVNQPKDVSFIIDALLKRNETVNDSLYQKLDAEKIAVAGVSLGGMTSTLVSFHPEVIDPRIKAAISIAGPSKMFTPAFFANKKTPLMMIAGTGDAILPYPDHAAPLPAKFPGSILVSLQDASHAGFAAPAATFMRFFDNPDTLGCDRVTKGLGKDTGINKSMQPFFRDDYGIDLSGEQMPCPDTPIAKAMNAPRQHLLTTLAAFSFLQSQFAEEAQQREQAEQFLLTHFAAENSDVRVERQLAAVAVPSSASSSAPAAEFSSEPTATAAAVTVESQTPAAEVNKAPTSATTDNPPSSAQTSAQ